MSTEANSRSSEWLVFEHPERGMFEVSGPDARDYLQRMSTNSLKNVNADAISGDAPALPTLFLKGDGRLVASCWVSALAANSFLLTTDAETREALYEYLDRMHFAEKLELKDVSAVWKCFQFVLVEAGHMSGWPADLQSSTFSNTQDCRVFSHHSGNGKNARQEIWIRADLEPAALENTLHEVAGPEFRSASHEEYHTLRVQAGEPAWGAELTPNTIPLEAGLKYAIDFTKGCFPGQEIVARIENLGHPANILVGIAADEPLTVGDSLFSDDKQIGKVTSAALSPANGKPIALAYVKWDFREPGTIVHLRQPRGTQATVHALPFNGS